MSCLFRIMALACLIAGGSTLFLSRVAARQREEKKLQLAGLESRLESKQAGRADWRKGPPGQAEEAQAAAEKELLDARNQLREEMEQLEKRGLTKAEIAILVEQPPDQVADYVSGKVLRRLPFDDRLINGQIIRDGLPRNPSGAPLTVRNAMVEDAAVKLSGAGGTEIFFYVRGSQSHTLAGIPDGSYRLRYSRGFDWDQRQEDFVRGRAAHAWEDFLEFSAATTTEGLSITLPKAIPANARIRSLKQEEFRK